MQVLCLEHASQEAPERASSFKTEYSYRQSGIQQSALSIQPKQGIQRIATLCRPNSKNEKTMLKLIAIGRLNNPKKGFDRSVDRSVESRLGLCFQ